MKSILPPFLAYFLSLLNLLDFNKSSSYEEIPSSSDNELNSLCISGPSLIFGSFFANDLLPYIPINLILLLPIVAIDKSDMVFLDLGYKN
jgi:hypothetical protein